MAKHSDESQDRALISRTAPTDGDGALRVNPAGACRDVMPAQIGVVPLARTMAKPQAYKPGKNQP